MKVAVIDNYDSFVFNLVRYIEELTGKNVLVQRNDQINLSELELYDAIILSPGPGIPSEAGDLSKVIAHFAETKKILGVCLGHQALVEFFGGSLKQNLQPLHGKVSMIHQNESGKIFKCLPTVLKVGRYHSWSADNLPSVLKCTAITSEGEIMAIEHDFFPITGVQFHPESIMTPEGRKMIRNWLYE